MRDEQLLDYLKGSCSGRKNRVGGTELERTLHVSGTDLRKLVNQLRRKTHPIASDRNGYFYATTAGEVYDTIRQLKRMAAGLEAAINGLERSMDRFREDEGPDMAKPPFPWIGSKEKIAPYILQLFPPKLTQYVEPFGGSGAVLLALPPDPNRLDIYNDLDAELVNLFSCIKECSNVLLRELKFLPIHGRKLFEYYRDFVAHKEVYFQNVQAEIECLGDRSCFTEEQAGELLPIFQERLALYDVKRAAAYYLAIRGSFSGTINSFGVKGLDVERFLKLFPPVSARLKDVPLENKNALQLIRERDKKGSLIYADPPYVKTERLYRVAGKLGRFRRFHVRLWQVLTDRDSYVVLSYNDCPFIRKLYQDWYILSFQRSNPLSQKRGSSFGELIITNYDPRPYMTSQMNLFDEPLGEWELKLVHIPNHPPRRKTA